MQATLRTPAAPVKAGPAPIAPELLKLIGGGAGTTTSTPTPQAPKNRW
jgi:hypothetical protein